MGKIGCLSLCVVEHSACQSSSVILLPKTSCKYKIDAHVKPNFWCVGKNNNYVWYTCVYLCNNEGREVNWADVYPTAYILNLIYLESTKVTAIPLALIK